MKPKQTPNLLTPDEARLLAERYFDALTTEAEELTLKRYICSPEGLADPALDEVRALMGLGAWSRKVKREAAPALTPRGLSLPSAAGAIPAETVSPDAATRTLRPRRRRAALVRWTAAAILVIAASLSSVTIVYNHNNQCVAYIDGHKVTDPHRVEAAMRSSLHEVATPRADQPTVEAQLGDMFKTID